MGRRRYKRDGRGRFAGGSGGNGGSNGGSKPKKRLTAAQKQRRKRIILGAAGVVAVGAGGALLMRHGAKKSNQRTAAHNYATIAAKGKLTKKGKAKAYSTVYSQVNGKKTTYRGAKSMNAHSAASLSATNKAGRVKQFRAGRSLNKVSAAHVTKSPVIKASITATIKKNGSRHGLRAASKMILKATSR